MSGRPRTACRRCNSHKVRCTGLRPACQRCQRAKQPCIYDAPSTAFHSTNAVGISQLVSGLAPGPSHALPQHSGALSHGIPQTLMHKLIDVYFLHVYNARLLVHRPTFLQQLADNAVPDHVVLSMCALASSFLSDANGKLWLRENEFGREWAKRAGQLVFCEAEHPRHENIPTFINLALFWYAEGEWIKSAVYKFCDVKHLITQIPSWTANGLLIARLSGMPMRHRACEVPIHIELKSRRIWACLVTNSFSPEGHLEQGLLSEAARDYILPCPEDDFEKKETMCGETLSSGIRDGSAYGELIRVLTFWDKVCSLIQKPWHNFSSRLGAIHEIDNHISNWRSELPPFLKIDGERIPSELQIPLPILFGLHIIYHQCLCSLHASIVPLFCWGSSVEPFSSARQMSAQIAYDNANSVSNLAKMILNGAYEASRTPSFVGYACYCACAIQIPFLRCANPSVSAQAKQNILTNLKLIQQMGQYWRFISLLGINIRTIYEVHSNYPCNVDDEPKNMDASKLNELRIDAERARSSILVHNNILRGRTGSAAQLDADVTDLGLDNLAERSTATSEETIESLITELSAPWEQTAGDLDASEEQIQVSQVLSQLLHVESVNGGPFAFPYSGQYSLDQLDSGTDWAV
ncbi:hypothetical protein ASPBRDRAFT_68120 [Aspergillus brasiliensis CBS 101740]|uniref:Zn(2)-C6 fungal-type domain-containing protein n=1 Tax=Aspergillus brasiliensis (strain CBS 101740 / IMI 381727 / IBT 21946) TaxID=767769 RepID=A0A1L9UAI0_ASPBC|nr:hypothetical protein ASPBRDRAFT_68120 [Aspergillus brasiliensis CBS 101740]